MPAWHFVMCLRGKLYKKYLFSIPRACHLWIFTRGPLVDVRYATHILVKESTRQRAISAWVAPLILRLGKAILTYKQVNFKAVRHLHLGWLCCCRCGSRCCWSGFSWRWWQCCGRGCRYCCCGVLHSHLEVRLYKCPRSATAQEDVVLNLAPGVYIPLLYQLHPSSQFVNLSFFCQLWHSLILHQKSFIINHFWPNFCRQQWLINVKMKMKQWWQYHGDR